MSLDSRIFRQLCENAEVTALDHDCKGCGECCSQFLPMTIAEVIRLKSHVKKNGIKATYQPILCPFFDADTRLCKVYEVRPQICRTYDCKKHKNGELFSDQGMAKILGKVRIVDMAKEFCNGQ